MSGICASDGAGRGAGGAMVYLYTGATAGMYVAGSGIAGPGVVGCACGVCGDSLHILALQDFCTTHGHALCAAHTHTFSCGYTYTRCSYSSLLSAVDAPMAMPWRLEHDRRVAAPSIPRRSAQS